MDSEREWKNELVEKFYQAEEGREENHWHHKDLNINILRFFLFFEKKVIN